MYIYSSSSNIISSFKILLFFVLFPNLFLSEFNNPSLVTKVLPLDVANGDLPLNSRLPLLPLSYFVASFLSFALALFGFISFLPVPYRQSPPQPSFLAIANPLSSPPP